MSDWEVGDLAVKVGGDFSVMPKGTVSVVTGLHSGEHHPSGIIGLVLGGWDDEDDYYCFCWDPTNFRKIRPDAHEGCEEEFATLVKRKSAPSPQEREKRILEALFPGRAGANK